MLLGNFSLLKYLFFAAGAGIGLFIKNNGLVLPYPCMEEVVSIPPEVLPHPSFLEGIYEPNTLLYGATKLFVGKILGSESVALSPSGSLIMCDKYGAVWEAKPDPAAEGGFNLEATPVAYLYPGRPLGFHVDPDGDLLVCNAGLGLVKLEAGTKRYEILATRVSDTSPIDPGTPLHYVNDLDLSHVDGTIYFTDSGGLSPIKNRAGFWDTMAGFLLVTFQGKLNGRILKYSPTTRETAVLGSGYYYSNGIALSADESFLAVVETNGMRLWRHWLKGPKAGTREVLLDNLPGFPDGVSRGSDGNFWLALVVPNNKFLLNIMPFRWARWVAAWIPAQLKPPIKPWGCILQVSPDGKVLRVLMDPNGTHISSTSSATEVGGRLYIGNLGGDYVSYLELSNLPPPCKPSGRPVAQGFKSRPAEL